MEDLLFHLPVRWEDRSVVVPVAALAAAGTAGPWTLRGRLSGLTAIRTRRRRFSLVRGRLADASGEIAVVWFNRPYLPRQVIEGEEYLLHGEAKALAAGGFELLNPSCERAEAALHGGRVVPVYPALGSPGRTAVGFGPAALRRLLARLVVEVDPAASLLESLPPALLERHGLAPLGAAIAYLHAPPEGCDVAALNRRRSPAHLRLIYGELLELQLELALLRSRQVAEPKRHAYRVDDAVRRVAREVLPFKLTGAQKRVLREIVDDLRDPRPMLRLLQGDVGSGKTIVAALAFVIALESGLQGAFMAPTELLAEQHFESLSRLLGGRYRVELFTGSRAEAGKARRDLAAGRVQLAVGTHALIQQGIEFARLGLAVVDEQHRFGVAQRQLLQQKGDRPDLLVMTATPIPRSLALTAYGDLEVSLLDELPPGRSPVATEVLPERQRGAVYARLREELAAGAQAYVVFPLIEASREIEAAAVEEMGERVRQALADFPSAVVHGRLPAAERERVMTDFAAGLRRVLIATTVIEVGVDVPGATAMVIESAERFGLAQLHQLRGRVGRGDRPSRCVALHGRLTAEAKRRLEVFAATTDGFEIAEADLALRGPGDLLGTRQAGLPTLRVADLVADRDWLLRAREDAGRLLARWDDPALAPLVRRVEPRLASRLQCLGGG